MAITKILNIKSQIESPQCHRVYFKARENERAVVGWWKCREHDTRGVPNHDGYQTDMGKAGWKERIPYHHQWKPGECTEEKAYQILQEFCQEYLGENYDYVFGIHTDRKHCHGHIVFNSVNRVTGYKYTL